LIVDDDVPTRVGLHTILESESDITVVDECADGSTAYEKAIALRPDVVLMDVQLGGEDGITATERILSESHEDAPKVIVLTTFELDEYAFRSLQAGASGFLLKRSRAEDIIDAVRTVADGTALPLPKLSRRLIEEFVAAQSESPALALTSREAEVLLLIARGLSNDEISRTLGIRRETVKSHIKHVFTKLGVRDRAQAVIAAYESGLVSPGDGSQSLSNS
jgi:DNA-binding NarL/FixJ family response regulator